MIAASSTSVLIDMPFSSLLSKLLLSWLAGDNRMFVDIVRIGENFGCAFQFFMLQAVGGCR